MKITIKYVLIFYLILVSTVNLISMENTINEKIDYLLCFELLLRKVINIDHHIVGVLSLTNKKLNEIVHLTIEKRKQYLFFHATKQPNSIPFNIVFNSLGSTCAFITATDRIPKNAWGWNIDLCRLQLAENNKISKYTHHIMIAHRWSSTKKSSKLLHTFYKHKSRSKTVKIQIETPMFDSYSNAYIYTVLDSFHLNTQCYLIDKNGENRKIILLEK